MVLLLTVRPCCADDCAAKASGEKTTHSDTSSKEKECPGCSPFFSCGACAGFVVAKAEHMVFVAQLEFVTHNSTYQQPQLQETTASIWQPPQLS
jgi:hypothetical protein